jgi:pimeloyl-ACP methyl ester carboxylesterase
MKRLLAGNGSFVLIVLVLLALSMIGYVPVSYAKQASYDVPSTIDASAKYLFFLHNYYVEKHGPDGDCKYYALLNAFADSGFTVISEVRSGKIIPCAYAGTIVDQIRTLLDAGVPPENITVAGHSKGGVIALCVSSKLGNPKVHFVVMAGCEIKPLLGAYPDYRTLLPIQLLAVATAPFRRFLRVSRALKSDWKAKVVIDFSSSPKEFGLIL